MCSSGSAKLSPLPCGLIGVAVLQQLDHHVVELDEAHVEPLRPAGEIGNGDRSRVHPARSR